MNLCVVDFKHKKKKTKTTVHHTGHKEYIHLVIYIDEEEIQQKKETSVEDRNKEFKVRILFCFIAEFS